MTTREVHFGPLRLTGDLDIPEGSMRGVVLFAHGTGSSRASPRNRFVAARLNRCGLATLLFDLLTEEEEFDRRNVFDIYLLAQRLGDGLSWKAGQPDLADLPCGLFGASTGAAAALVTAAAHPGEVAAVVSRGGRPDLADAALPLVQAPTLLIVGGADVEVLELNRWAADQMHCPHALEVVEGATHLFEEPGALDDVATLASNWFVQHMKEPVHA
jgi:putative phosphoribosyl transferase